MEYDSTSQVIIFITLLCLSAFFSASETALMTLSKLKVRHMVEEEIKGAKTIDKLIQNPGKLLSAILVGNNIVNIGASALATSLAIHYFGDKGVGVATGVVTLLVLIFGEITPKSIASTYAERIALVVAKPIQLISLILTPITSIFTHLAGIFVKLFGGSSNPKPFITEEELKTMVDVSHEEGVLEVGEKKMIHNVFEFNDTVVKDVMTQRINIVAIERKTSLSEIIKIFKEEQYSRVPVYDETIDNIIGVIHIKDMIFIEEISEGFNIDKYLRKSFFTFEYRKIHELFSEMKKKQVTQAIVMDEYGGVAGLVTMEDLIEEIVGDISDEYDEIIKEIEKVSENEFVIEGTTKIDLVNETLDAGINSDEYDTIGGFIIGQLGDFPVSGTIVKHHNIEFLITEVENYRIKKLRVILKDEDNE